MFEEAAMDEDAFEDVFDDYDETEINFHGMSPKDFATFLVEHDDEAEELYDTTWSITVHHEVTDDEEED